MDKWRTIHTSATGFSVEVRAGLIINEKVDIIINTTTQDINLQVSPLNVCVRGDGINQLRFDKIHKECESKAPQGLEIGEYVVSGIGRDHDDRYIYHGCVMDSSGKIIIQEYLAFIEECFEAATCMNYQTLALPLVSMHRYSQAKFADEKAFANNLLDKCIATLAENKDFRNMRLVLVDMKNSALHEEYASVLISLNQQSYTQSDVPPTQETSGKKPSTPTFLTQPNYNQLTQSIGPGTSGGARPKILPRTNSTGSNSDVGLNETLIFDKRKSRSGSARNRATSNTDSSSYGNNMNDDSRTAYSTALDPSGTEIPVLPSRSGRNNNANVGQGSSSIQGKNTSHEREYTSNGGRSSAFGNDLAVTVYQGDITQADVETVVHGSNCIKSDIDLRGAVGSALKKAGGRGFENACKNLDKASDKRLVITAAGTMKFKKILHINTSMCNFDSDWRQIIRSCLDEAEQGHFKSIAFPALGAIKVEGKTQANNFKTVLGEFKTTKPRYLEQAYIVIHDDNLYDTYKRVIDSSGNTNTQVVTYPSRHGSGGGTASGSATNPSLGNNLQPFSTIYKGVKIEVKEGDITRQHVECIVHGFVLVANVYAEITLSDPVGKAIEHEAGDEFKKDCKRARIAKGQIEVTSGGSLCKRVIHADILEYTVSSMDKEPNWKTYVRRCLGKAKDCKIESVAFPLVGIRDANIYDVAQLQIAGAKESIDEYVGTLRNVRFVIYNNSDAYQSFNKAAYFTFGNKSSAGNQGLSGSSGTATATGQRLRTTGIINNISVEVVEGDITQDDSEMIVHGTTNSRIGIVFRGKMGSAITEAGGSTFIRECEGKSVSPKSYTVTVAGKMKSLKVIHIDVFSLKKDDRKEWKEAMAKTMQVAYYHKTKSLGVPPIGMGNATTSEVQTILSAFKEAIREHDTKMFMYPKQIRFVICNNPALFYTFQEILLPPTKPSSTQGGRHTPHVSSQVMSQKITFKGGMTIEIIGGDLTKERTGAIVHVTNRTLAFAGQSGEAIKKAGGKELEEACSKAKFGWNENVTFTDAGKLQCRKVLHLNASSLNNETAAGKVVKLKALIHECLVEANRKGLHSLSFPALGTGSLKCELMDVAKCFKSAVEQFIGKSYKPALAAVRIIMLDDQMLHQLATIFNSL